MNNWTKVRSTDVSRCTGADSGDDGTGGKTLSESAYLRLKTDIIRGVRHPGERLRIERLRAIYGIGPTPLREALQRLSAERLVLCEGNRGFSVSPLDPTEFADLTAARTAIECEALRLSIANGDDAWEAGIVAARHIIRKEDDAIAGADGEVPESWEAANTAFHLALVAACGSRWLLRIRSGLHDLCERYRRKAVFQEVGSRALRNEHDSIADAVLARDAEVACALTKAHFQVRVRVIENSVRERGVQPAAVSQGP